MFLSDQDLAELTEWRRNLHRAPELSGDEKETARRVCEALRPSGPTRIIERLGGHGVAAVYEAASDGPTILLRAELDALPIEELSNVPHRSTVPGKAHLCGHDGHMAMLLAVARGLGREPPKSGRVILLFQPAEEDGSGAAAVIADERFPQILPDISFACHNLPGLPLGEVALAEGPVNCASRGMRITMRGKTAHASMPEQGHSPAPAIARFISALTAESEKEAEGKLSMVTVTHVRIGEPAFGIAPGRAELWATLRTLTDEDMDSLVSRTETLAAAAIGNDGLEMDFVYGDIFRHCENSPEAVAHLRHALDAGAIPYSCGGLPLRASEDFGLFGRQAPAAMFFLGAGVDRPSLHNPDYDFPDALIPIGANIFMRGTERSAAISRFERGITSFLD